MVNKLMLRIISITAALTLSACAGENKEETNQEKVQTNEMPGHDMENLDHSGMNHSGTGEVPEGLKEADHPTFSVGSKATIQTDHMAGMNDAEATIVGAYDTTVYTVTYTPTNGGEPVTNHKWVIHEELEGAGEELLEPGTEVILNADHMVGMASAAAIIDSAERTTVYMVDYTSSTGEKVTNHKWVTESELSAQ